MPFHNESDRTRLAYLGALTLLFSYAEILLPRFVPFMHLGLGNIVLLLAFDLSPLMYFELILIKAVSACLMAGNLFSPFFLLSISQSIVSGFAMFFLYRINSRVKIRLFSVYGISVFGSAVSSIVQIFMSSLYLGQGTYSLLGPMLFFCLASGLITAFLSEVLSLPKNTPVLTRDITETKNKSIYYILLLFLACGVITFMVNDIRIIAAELVIAIVMQLLSGRKFLILPHITMWLFVIISSLLVPDGKVLVKLGFISITEGALLDGLSKSMKLSAAAALSQSASALRITGNGMIAYVLAYYNALRNTFYKTEGKLVNRIKQSLSAEELVSEQKAVEAKSSAKTIINLILMIVFIGLFVFQKIVLKV